MFIQFENLWLNCVIFLRKFNYLLDFEVTLHEIGRFYPEQATSLAFVLLNVLVEVSNINLLYS